MRRTSRRPPPGTESPAEKAARWRHLPPPIRPEEMRTSAEVTEYDEPQDDYWREVQWMLKITGGG